MAVTAVQRWKRSSHRAVRVGAGQSAAAQELVISVRRPEAIVHENAQFALKLPQNAHSYDRTVLRLGATTFLLTTVRETKSVRCGSEH